MQGATTKAYKGDRYVEEERRRSWPPAAATPRRTQGWADRRRPAALLVARVPGILVRHAPPALRASPLGPARPREVMKGALSPIRHFFMNLPHDLFKQIF